MDVFGERRLINVLVCGRGGGKLRVQNEREWCLVRGGGASVRRSSVDEREEMAQGISDGASCEFQVLEIVGDEVPERAGTSYRTGRMIFGPLEDWCAHGEALQSRNANERRLARGVSAGGCGAVVQQDPTDDKGGHDLANFKCTFEDSPIESLVAAV